MKFKRSIAVIAVTVATAAFSARAAEHRPLLVEFAGPQRAGYLGAGVRDVTEERAVQLKLKDAHGVEVVALDHDGPAAKAGLREHDVILQMNGQPVPSYDQLRRLLRETPAGRKADLVLSRDGAEVTLQVVLGDRLVMARVAMPDLSQLDAQLSEMRNVMAEELPSGDVDVFTENGTLWSVGNVGVQVENLAPQLAIYFGLKDGSGVLVREVRADSAGARAGLKAGDVIVRAAEQKVQARADWQQTLRSNRGKTVQVEVMREHHSQKLALAVPANTQGSLLTPGSLKLDTEVHAGVQQAMAALKQQMESPEFKRQMEEAQDSARKAVAEWKNNPEFEKQMKEAAEQAKKAAEEFQFQFSPMD